MQERYELDENAGGGNLSDGKSEQSFEIEEDLDSWQSENNINDEYQRPKDMNTGSSKKNSQSQQAEHLPDDKIEQSEEEMCQDISDNIPDEMDNLSQEQIVISSRESDLSGTCPICMDDFEANASLYSLPCGHHSSNNETSFSFFSPNASMI